MSEEKLTKEDIIKSFNGRFYYLDDYTCFLYEELERLHSIINETREYIEEHSEMTDLQINGIENVLAFRGSCKKLLEILDKVEDNK